MRVAATDIPTDFRIRGLNSALADILKAMPTQRLVLLLLAGLCFMWLCVRIGKYLWRELNEYLRDQRFGE
ncbi:hypothetical protein AciX9_4645 (plasmid) [Granulicella tundricola MP5ACTX9]|uniref:Uncharacterized protein n=1 Tax=Granulicella tundricola (strain ATCC BAA-1859 / DSM 23138 / MP5ACTX9) TaxID=1198114 RepID=E8X7Z1_GRATM|nr:hypothetical protein AciX9_4645 [Granulicella tundricola MP5ACTX9]